MRMCNFACKGRLRNDLYCVGRDVKPYLLTHSSSRTAWVVSIVPCSSQSENWCLSSFL